MANQQRHAAETLNFLKARVREEALAAANAASVEATLIHVALATAYAKRFGESSCSGPLSATDWVNQNRVW